MLKRLLNSLLSDSDMTENHVSSLFDRAKLKMLFEYFPIGYKPHYTPEFQRSIVFRTIILGYRVNDHYLYSRDTVLMDEEEQPSGFRIAPERVLALSKLKKFQIVLPDTSEMEKKLDYFTRAELGRTGQFGQGNTITLIGESAERGVPTVDTLVDRRQVLSDGPYANSSTILLTPDFTTLAITDKRRKQRVDAGIPARLYFDDEAPLAECILGDFSELSLRVNIAAPGQIMPPVTVIDTVIVDFDFGDITSTYRVRGKVFRRTDEFCVVKLEQIFRDDAFERIRMMDVMEIKTSLLNRKA